MLLSASLLYACRPLGVCGLMCQFTFWFVYVVYVFDSVGFFGPEIVGILTVWIGWGFRLEGSNSVFCFGVAILQRFGGGSLLCFFRVRPPKSLFLLDFFGRK